MDDWGISPNSGFSDHPIDLVPPWDFDIRSWSVPFFPHFWLLKSIEKHQNPFDKPKKHLSNHGATISVHPCSASRAAWEFVFTKSKRSSLRWSHEKPLLLPLWEVFDFGIMQKHAILKVGFTWFIQFIMGGFVASCWLYYTSIMNNHDNLLHDHVFQVSQLMRDVTHRKSTHDQHSEDISND